MFLPLSWLSSHILLFSEFWVPSQWSLGSKFYPPVLGDPSFISSFVYIWVASPCSLDFRFINCLASQIPSTVSKNYEVHPFFLRFLLGIFLYLESWDFFWVPSPILSESQAIFLFSLFWHPSVSVSTTGPCPYWLEFPVACCILTILIPITFFAGLLVPLSLGTLDSFSFLDSKVNSPV